MVLYIITSLLKGLQSKPSNNLIRLRPALPRLTCCLLECGALPFINRVTITEGFEIIFWNSIYLVLSDSSFLCISSWTCLLGAEVCYKLPNRLPLTLRDREELSGLTNFRHLTQVRTRTIVWSFEPKQSQIRTKLEFIGLIIVYYQ